MGRVLRFRNDFFAAFTLSANNSFPLRLCAIAAILALVFADIAITLGSLDVLITVFITCTY